MKLGIIGTAGRQEDGQRLRDNPGYWRTILAITQAVVTTLRPTELVSGGAAYADHAAVIMFLEEEVSKLALHLPAEWDGYAFKEGFDKFDAGRTANHYHTLFSEDMKIDSLSQIRCAVKDGASVTVNPAGFKARNSDVANSVDALLAFTFGMGPALKDGGTQDTWSKFLSRREQLDGAYVYLNDGMPALHYCLNSKKMFRV